MAGATRNCSHLGASSVYTIQPSPCHFMQSHIHKVYACLAVTPATCILAEWPGSFTCYCGNTGGGMDIKIRVSTESQPWRRKFSGHSCRHSNLWPFNHESSTLTTKPSPPFTTKKYWGWSRLRGGVTWNWRQGNILLCKGEVHMHRKWANWRGWSWRRCSRRCGSSICWTDSQHVHI